MRKSLYDISWKCSEPEYRAAQAYSYSTLSRFNREGFQGLNNLYDKIETPSLLFGSIVDTLLTGTEEEFQEAFVIADLAPLSESIQSIVKSIWEDYHTQYMSLDDVPDTLISSVAKEYNYYANDKYSNYRVKLVRESGTDYYNLLSQSEGKKLISLIDYNDALNCANALREHPLTSQVFNINNIKDNTEVFYQLKFKGTYNEIPIKCMMDACVVNHANKTITPVDLKTSSKPEYQFYTHFIHYNYFIQAQLYSYLLQEYINKSADYKDYKIQPYIFIVISRKTLNPLAWNYNDNFVTVDKVYGKKQQFLCRNWRGLLLELDSYLKEQPQNPFGIETTKSNNIIKWLNNED